LRISALVEFIPRWQYLKLTSLSMNIGKRVRKLREEKGLTQTEVARRTGLLPSYVSRIEGNRTNPEIPMLERIASALGIQVYQFFFEGCGQPAELPLFKRMKERQKDAEWAELQEFGRLLARMSDRYRAMLFGAAQHMAKRSARSRGARFRTKNRISRR
jgi:transcriptional regulator with XRE-family HTH domain